MSKAELTIEIDEALVDEANALHLDIAASAVEGVRRAVAQKHSTDSPQVEADSWARENAEAIELHRKRIDEFGVFGEDLRNW
jgi:post-segregation antitoxin (ccd killing protein)